MLTDYFKISSESTTKKYFSVHDICTHNIINAIKALKFKSEITYNKEKYKIIL